jgi:hypothetical protein
VSAKVTGCISPRWEVHSDRPKSTGGSSVRPMQRQAPYGASAGTAWGEVVPGPMERLFVVT